jgi:hypothetical protein
MNARLLLAAALLALMAGCTRYTTKFHTAGNPAPEPHERRTTADAFGGADFFDLGKQCENGWADLTFEARVGKGMTETWRCRTEEHAATATPSAPPTPAP